MKNHSFLLFAGLVLIAGCKPKESSSTSTSVSASKKLVVGVAFETLQTEYWVAGFEAIRAELGQRDIEMAEAVADGDANRQLEQVKNFITRKVDGIILVPKDAQTCLPMIRAANAAGIPMVLFNRPAEKSDAQSVAVIADNVALTRETVNYLIGEAKKTGHKHQAMILIGDLGDINAIGRRDGFDAAIAENNDWIEVVARVPTEWNQEKAQAGVVNALQAHPDIDFIFTSSDFLLPGIVSALKNAGKYRKVGDSGHVLLAGFDGDATAYAMIRDGYLDATGVQDVSFEAKQAVETIIDIRAGKTVQSVVFDPGFVIHQKNLAEKASRMWGATAAGK